MPLSYTKSKIYENKHIVDNIYLMEIELDAKVEAGQFYMLRGWGCEPILPRPISIYNYENGIISFLYMVCGVGTEHFKNLKKDDKIELLGPLGNGFPLDRLTGNVAVVAGGIGIAPMLYTVREMNAENINVYCGFRNTSYGIDEISKIVNNVYISTETGCEGTKGYCIDNFDPKKYDAVITCGPEIMMKKVAQMCNEADVECYLSMENHIPT